MDPIRIEVADGIYVRSWQAAVPAGPRDLAALERLCGPLPADYRAFLARADGAAGEIEDEEERGADLLLFNVAEVLGTNFAAALGLARQDDWRYDTVLAGEGNLLVGTTFAYGRCVLEARSDGGWEYVDVRTDFQSEPVSGVETRFGSWADLMRHLKTSRPS